MSNIFELEAEVRESTGQGASRRLRRNNKIPAIVYGGGKAAQSIVLDHFKISKALQNEAVYSHILTLHINGSKEQAVIKDLQRHPWKPVILHMDFLRINPDEKIIMQVPLHFTGADKAPGVKAGGNVMHLMNSIEIRCLPAKLPEFISVDLSNLGAEESISLSDLALPEGVELMAFAHGGTHEEHNAAVVKIHIPRAAEEATPAAEATAAAPAAAATPAKTEKKDKK